MDLEIATGIVFAVVSIAGIATASSEQRHSPLAPPIAMIVGGAFLLAVALLAPEHHPEGTDVGMHALHEIIGGVFIAGGLLSGVGVLAQLRALQAVRGYTFIATGALVAIDGTMHGGDQLRSMIAMALVLAALIDIAGYLAKEESRTLATLAWLLLAAGGVVFITLGAGEDEHGRGARHSTHGARFEGPDSANRPRLARSDRPRYGS